MSALANRVSPVGFDVNTALSPNDEWHHRRAHSCGDNSQMHLATGCQANEAKIQRKLIVAIWKQFNFTFGRSRQAASATHQVAAPHDYSISVQNHVRAFSRAFTFATRVNEIKCIFSFLYFLILCRLCVRLSSLGAFFSLLNATWWRVRASTKDR